jgi:hypothetical protein
MDAPNSSISDDEKKFAVISHLLSFAGFFFPFGNILGPLVIYLLKKDESEYVRHHAAEALNFQINMTVYISIAALLIFIFIGIILLPIVLAIDVILTIVAAVRASNKIRYTYPLTIRFFD